MFFLATDVVVRVGMGSGNPPRPSGASIWAAGARKEATATGSFTAGVVIVVVVVVAVAGLAASLGCLL